MLWRFTTGSHKPNPPAACSIRLAEGEGGKQSCLPPTSRGHACPRHRAARLISSSDAGSSNAEVSAEFFAETSGAHNSAHHLRVSRLWYVADENDVASRERFAEMGVERVF